MEAYILPALFAFVLTFFLTLIALRFFPIWGLMDKPAKYNLKRKPIPYYGGAIMIYAFTVSILFFVPMSLSLVGLIIGVLLLGTISFLDDMFGLSPFLRLGIQVLSALILVICGIGITSISNPIGDPILLDQIKWEITIDQIYTFSVMSALFTIVWVIAIVNTMNFLDGINGLSSGVAVVASLALFLLSIRPGIHYDLASQEVVATIAIILFAVALAFWLFEFHPAKILMGDTGSIFLGFVLATLAIFSGGKVATAFLVMGFPVLDAFWAIFRRILAGKSPFKGDLMHLHHKLLKSGLNERQTLTLIYVLCALFGGIAVYLESIQKLYAIIVMAVLMFILGGIATVKGKRG